MSLDSALRFKPHTHVLEGQQGNHRRPCIQKAAGVGGGVVKGICHWSCGVRCGNSRQYFAAQTRIPAEKRAPAGRTLVKSCNWVLYSTLVRTRALVGRHVCSDRSRSLILSECPSQKAKRQGSDRMSSNELNNGCKAFHRLPQIGSDHRRAHLLPKKGRSSPVHQ